jgi:hypothetical protein
VTIRAVRFVAEDGVNIVPEPPNPEPPSVSTLPTGDAAAGRRANAPKPSVRRDPALDAVLARAAEYVRAYSRHTSVVVSEEVYEQKIALVGQAVVFGPTSRKLVSDFLLAQVPGGEGWLPFRDVFEVDGVLVRDREDRLTKLFLDAPADAERNAAEILRESARYNIGPINRTLNIPTLPLWFFDPASYQSFTFRKRGEETIDGSRVWVVSYSERGRSTVIKTWRGGDVPASGELWIDPVNGRVLKTLLMAGAARITVTYRPRAEVLGLWMPVEMLEEYSFAGGRIEAKASYSKFRRFQVFTEEHLKKEAGR